MSSDIVQRQRFNDEDLRNITTWDDLNAMFTEYGADVVSADEVLGTGFELLSTDDKATLVGVPLVLIDWRFNEGDQGEFVSIMAASNTGGVMRKVIINDGSTGIRDQLKTLVGRGISGPMLVKKGLVRSDYEYEDDKGVKRPATTYYLSESA